MVILKQMILKIYINISHVKNYLNRLIYVMVVSLEVVVERKDILIMLEKMMILIKKLKVKLEKELI